MYGNYMGLNKFFLFILLYNLDCIKRNDDKRVGFDVGDCVCIGYKPNTFKITSKV